MILEREMWGQRASKKERQEGAERIPRKKVSRQYGCGGLGVRYIRRS